MALREGDELPGICDDYDDNQPEKGDTSGLLLEGSLPRREGVLRQRNVRGFGHNVDNCRIFWYTMLV
jgi:hypothetical protein